MDSDKLQTASPMGADGPMELDNVALVPVAGPQQLADYNPMAGFQQFWCNWKLDSRQDKARVMKCFNDVAIKPSDILNTTIRMSHVLIHPVELADETTGEVFSAHRVAIVLDDGSIVAFVSRGILKSLSLICMMEGKGPWLPPLAVKLRQLELKSGRRWYQLDLVDESQPEQPKGAKRNGSK